MPGGAEEGIEVEKLPLVLSLALCGGADGSGGMPSDAEEGIKVEMLPLVLSLAPCGGAGEFFDKWNQRGIMQANAQEAAITKNHITQVLFD